MKRIVTVQDISCVGKCSMTVALPILSAMGVETAVLPTAVLSAHTKFHDVTYYDLTNQIAPIAAHWQREGVTFDGIYTGYLGNCEQVDQVASFVDAFHSKDNVVIVDPVMGDHGRLYTGITNELGEKMGELCRKADVILPNITEACRLTGTIYRENYDRQYIEELLQGLCKICKGVSILTGVSFTPDQTGVMGMDSRTGALFFYSHEKLSQSYHGTGDIFAATFSGSMLSGKNCQQAVQIASDFTYDCIQRTMQEKRDDKYGVCFEPVLPRLIAKIKGE